MHVLQSHRARIQELKERLKDEIKYYEKAVKHGAGFNESKRLFMITKKTENELKEAILKYYKVLEKEESK